MRPAPATLRPTTSAQPFFYEGSELLALADARNYYRWLAAVCAPHLGTHTLEIGAGFGTMAAALLERKPDLALTLVEPASNNLPILRERFADNARVTIHAGYFTGLPDDVRRKDSVLLINVLEHVEDPHLLLEDARKSLRPGGRLVLLVPALPGLFGTLDHAFGHRSRFTPATLGALLHKSGFAPIETHYLNSLGVIPWFLLGRVVRRSTLRSWEVRLYDRLAIPLLSRIEGLFAPPIGQSLFAVAEPIE